MHQGSTLRDEYQKFMAEAKKKLKEEHPSLKTWEIMGQARDMSGPKLFSNRSPSLDSNNAEHLPMCFPAAACKLASGGRAARPA